jgi:hypothetical protein
MYLVLVLDKLCDLGEDLGRLNISAFKAASGNEETFELIGMTLQKLSSAKERLSLQGKAIPPVSMETESDDDGLERMQLQMCRHGTHTVSL